MRTAARLTAILLLLATVTLAPTPAAGGPAPLSLQILAINDLHGAVDTGRLVSNRPVGGAAYLAAHLQQRRLTNPNTLVVGVGDQVGGSPPISGLLQDEPTVRALDAMGMVLNAPGNHELDEGVEEFFRLTRGGCHPVTGCFEGARFKQISANILDAATGEPILPPYYLEYVRGVPVAFIGATHSGVPRSVVAGAVEGLAFPEPAAEVNRYVAQLKAQGVRTFVVLIHEGGFLDRQTRQLTGPITATVEALDPEVDVVISSHTHVGYAVQYAGKLVTQGFANGTAFVDVDLVLDPISGDVESSTAEVVTTFNEGVTPDPVVAQVVAEAEAQVAPRIGRVVNVAGRTISRAVNAAGESAIGNLIADAFRWSTGAQIGLMNSGGLREDIRAGEVTWGELFAVQPFGNQLVMLTLSGDQLYALFNEQWVVQSDGSERYRPNQVSGLRVVWDPSRPRGDRIVILTLDDGRSVERAERYTLAVNSFMAGGGEGYTTLLQGEGQQVVGGDLDALVAYVAQLSSPFEARVERRITQAP